MYKLCIMGNPVEHSKSPWIHAQFAKQFGLELEYKKIKPELNQFANAVREFQRTGGHGFNITMPFKQAAYELADETSQSATLAKAVNTILCREDGTLYGDNTDGLGLVADITRNLNDALKGKRILILGAGGVVRGILHPVLNQAPQQVTIANRTPAKAEQLAAELNRYGNISGCGFPDLADQTYDAILDGTGFSENELPLPESLMLTEHALCYDLKYSDVPTSFMRWAKRKGAMTVVDGIGMLIEQAAAGFLLWTQRQPDTAPVIRLAKEVFYQTTSE